MAPEQLRPMLPEGHSVEASSAVPAAEAVDRILASTESAVASIVRRTEHEVRGMAADLDARIARDAIERTARLVQLRRELTERASALAVHFEAILDQLDAVETALAAGSGAARAAAEPGDSRLMAIKMTLRERQRISVAYEQPEQPAEVPDLTPPAPMPMAVPESRRRWWRGRRREAA
jgi:hypothetical protein